MLNIDRLVFNEDQSSEVYFMNPETGIKNQVNKQLKTLKVEPKELNLWNKSSLLIKLILFYYLLNGLKELEC